MIAQKSNEASNNQQTHQHYLSKIGEEPKGKSGFHVDPDFIKEMKKKNPNPEILPTTNLRCIHDNLHIYQTKIVTDELWSYIYSLYPQSVPYPVETSEECSICQEEHNQKEEKAKERKIENSAQKKALPGLTIAVNERMPLRETYKIKPALMFYNHSNYYLLDLKWGEVKNLPPFLISITLVLILYFFFSI